MGKRSAGPSGVPIPLTTFIGRGQELAEVGSILERQRLVTLTGPGGVGKTRLVLEMAARHGQVFDDGVWILDLSPVSDPQLLPHTVAGALDLRDQSSSSVQEQLIGYLAHRHALIILDNCEHLLNDCSRFVSSLLTATEHLKIVATSRTTFEIAGEHVFSVPPLSLPSAANAVAGAERRSLEFEAVQLLLDRARAVQPDFAIDAANWPTVAALCIRLDGLPLAIELAATRLRSFSLEQLLQQLDKRFQVLRTRSPLALPRQQTLRALVDWSYELCDEQEQLLWSRLSVFTGGFELDAAVQTCGYGDLTHDEVVEGIDRLVSQSMLTTDHRESIVRYRMLETIREYGCEKLYLLGSHVEMQRRHRDFFLGLAQQVAQRWCGRSQAADLHRLRKEQGNIRAALDWSESHDSEHRHSLIMNTALRYHWFAGGNLSEGRQRLDQALSCEGDVPHERSPALWVAAWLSLLQGDHVAAAQRLEECEHIAKRIDDRESLSYVAHVRGTASLFNGNLQDAVNHFEEALEAHEAVGSYDGVLGMLFQLAIARSHRGEIEEAERICQYALDLSQRHGEQWGRSYAQWVLAFHTWRYGEVGDAVPIAREALAVKSTFSEPLGCALIVELLAWIAASESRFVDSTRYLGLAGAIWRHLGTNIAVFGPQLDEHHKNCMNTNRDALTPGDFESLLAEYSVLTADRAIARAAEAASNESTKAVPRFRPGSLTRREYEVAKLVAQGKSNRLIADQLVISKRTVDSHVEHIFQKLEMKNRIELVRWIQDARAAEMQTEGERAPESAFLRRQS